MESKNDAQKTLIHISHLHPLKLVACPEPQPVCHACHVQCADECYGCTECRYYLHTTCGTAKKCLDHPAHPAHTLTFELTPAYPSGIFGCDACGNEGAKFCFSCKECNYNLHLDCAAFPCSVNSQLHCHPLFLTYENPYPSDTEDVICDVCENYVHPHKWFYLCRNCDFYGHIVCFPEAIEAFLPDLPAQILQGLNQGNVATTMDDLQMQELLIAQARLESSMFTAELMKTQEIVSQSFMLANAMSDSAKDSI